MASSSSLTLNIGEDFGGGIHVYITKKTCFGKKIYIVVSGKKCLSFVKMCSILSLEV
jgi:hypothetical protein